jgi:NAD(P)H-dependent FMN reductase
MKVLIVTQSSPTGLNRKVAKICDSIAKSSEQQVVVSKIINADKVKPEDIKEHPYQIWIVPEWNGSFPYVFKKLIDDSGYPSSFSGIEILLIGTSDSTFGNLMGISHLEHILQWCGAIVFEKRVCLPFIKVSVESDGILEDERLRSAIKKFIC